MCVFTMPEALSETKLLAATLTILAATSRPEPETVSDGLPQNQQASAGIEPSRTNRFVSDSARHASPHPTPARYFLHFERNFGGLRQHATRRRATAIWQRRVSSAAQARHEYQSDTNVRVQSVRAEQLLRRPGR